MTSAPDRITPSSNSASQTGNHRRVFVDGLEIMASVGIYEVEHRYEQRVIISLKLEVTDTYDGQSERLTDVFDYSELVRITEALAQSRHYKLIETFAEDIATTCLKDRRIRAITVRIEKPDVITNCRSVGIEINRQNLTETP